MPILVEHHCIQISAPLCAVSDILFNTILETAASNKMHKALHTCSYYLLVCIHLYVVHSVLMGWFDHWTSTAEGARAILCSGPTAISVYGRSCWSMRELPEPEHSQQGQVLLPALQNPTCWCAVSFDTCFLFWNNFHLWMSLLFIQIPKLYLIGLWLAIPCGSKSQNIFTLMSFTDATFNRNSSLHYKRINNKHKLIYSVPHFTLYNHNIMSFLK